LAVPGFSLHSELQMLVESGLTPLEALRSATLIPTEFFGLEEEMGTVARGKKADMVLLNSNPLDQIAHTLDIHGVVTKGQYHAIATLKSNVTEITRP